MRVFSSFLPVIARYLLVVMLATVLAPGYAWQMLGGMDQAMLDAQETSPAHAHAEHEPASSVHLAHGAAMAETDCGGCELASSEHCDDLQHHCCPGHVLGHCPASFFVSAQAIFPVIDHVAVDRENRRFSTRIPEGIERPPRSISA